MRRTGKEHWCFRCYAPYGGYRKCRSITRAREKRGWKKREASS